MHTLSVRNVTEALPLGVNWLLTRGREESSRAGPVLVSPVPVTTVYTRPRERVLFAAGRDANPFFHLAETMWMLAGRQDATFLNNFVSDFGRRFAESASGADATEDGIVIHDAYGYRWREHFMLDQLKVIAEKLRVNPQDRQAVLTMWDPHDITLPMDNGHGSVGEELVTGNDLQGSWKTRPCNTHAYFRVLEEPAVRGGDRTSDPMLEMIVCCRSNDIVWGAYGANAVHFSFLQEYLAGMIGVDVGRMWQLSWNFHAYVAEIDRLTRRSRSLIPSAEDGVDDRAALMRGIHDERYYHGDLRNYEAPPLVTRPESFDREVRYVLELYECLDEGPPEQSAHEQISKLNNEFLRDVAWPMMMAHRHRREHDIWPMWIGATRALDWAAAGREWILRRQR